jgi:hypothetical protein
MMSRLYRIFHSSSLKRYAKEGQEREKGGKEIRWVNSAVCIDGGYKVNRYSTRKEAGRKRA